MSMRDNRPLIARPTWGRIKQGTIFTGAIAEGYQDCEVDGVVITARCDLVHDKVPLVNYLPVVRFDDWLKRDYARLLATRLEKSALGRIRDLLVAEGHSPTVLETLSPERVVEELFPEEGARGKAVRRGEKAREATAAIDLCRSCADGHPVLENLLVDLEELDPKAAQGLREECVRDRLSDYHFLSHVDQDGRHDGHVVLLRQVYHLPQALAADVAGGLELPCSEFPDALLASSGFAAPMGEIRSPFVELMMQRFMLLFSRIGVPDISREYSTGLITEVGRRA